MDSLSIFILQFVLSLFVFGLIAKWYLSPYLSKKTLSESLTILIFPHAIRHIGMTFLVPTVTGGSVPNSFAIAAGYGDLISAILAIICLFALRYSLKFAIPLIWLFSIVGTLDLINALRQAEAVPHLGATWYIPTFLVPILLVTQFMIFKRLIWKKP